MRHRSQIAGAVLAVILLATGAWWLNRGGGVSNASLEATNSVIAATGADGRTESPSETRKAASPPPAPSDVPTALGTVTLTGRVVSDRGLPIEGAQVACCSLLWISEGASRVDGIYATELPEHALFREQSSAADGRFQIVLEPPVSNPWYDAQVGARARGTARALARQRIRPGESKDLGDLVLRSGVMFAGSVVDTFGAPCADVRVFASEARSPADGSEAHEECRSSRDGSFRLGLLPAVTLNVGADAKDHRFQFAKVDLSDGQPRLDYQFVLATADGANSISGIVLDPAGNAVAAARLEVRSEPGSKKVLNLETQAFSDGRFRIEDVAGVSVEITASDQKENRAGPVKVTGVHSGTHGLELRLTSEGGITVRVRDEHAQPIERFAYEVHKFPFTVSSPLAAHPRGEATIYPDLKPFGLTVRAPGFISSEMDPLVPGQIPSPLDLQLARACVVRGVVLEGEKFVAKARVRLDREDYTDAPPKRKNAPPELTALTDAEGRFELTLERPGTITLLATSQAGNSPPTDPIAIRLGEDVEGIVIRIVETGAIVGIVSRHDGTPGARLNVDVLDAAERSVAKAETDAKGAFRVQKLAPGNYRLHVTRELGFMRLGGPKKSSAREPVDEWLCEVQSGKTSELALRLRETALLHLRLDLPMLTDGKWFVRCMLEDPRTAEQLSLEEMYLGGAFERTHEFIDPSPLGMWVEWLGGSGLLFLRARAPLERGTTEIVFAPAFGQIQGRLLLPIATDERVQLNWRNAEWTARVELAPDANGDYFIPFAPAGPCTLARTTRLERTQAIEVRAGELARAADL